MRGSGAWSAAGQDIGTHWIGWRAAMHIGIWDIWGGIHTQAFRAILDIRQGWVYTCTVVVGWYMVYNIPLNKIFVLGNIHLKLGR
jgi:hypothetical protein